MLRQAIINYRYLSVLILASTFVLGGCGSKTATTNSNSNSNSNSQTASHEPVQITTAIAEVRSMPTYFEATGSLAADAQSDVASTIGGKIAEVNFDVGSYVQKGAVLVRLDARDAQIRLEQAQAQVEQAKAGERQAKAAVEQARANLRQTQIRLGLTQGANFDTETFSQVKSVKAQLALAEKELARAERLLVTGDVSVSARDQRRATRDQLIGQLDEARSNAAVAVKAIYTAQEAVNTAQAQASTAQTNIGTALTQVDAARKAVSDTAIYAPISGYISERVADPGEYITPNAPNSKLCTIVRTSVLRMRIDVPEQSIGQVKTGQGISLQTSSYPDRNFAGTVARILPSVNTASRTLTVEAEVENGEGLLKPGQFATVRITQGKAAQAVVIPVTAVRTEGDINRVFVIKDGRAEERIVQLGMLENDKIEVKQGVVENEVVATGNLGQLVDGADVRQ